MMTFREALQDLDSEPNGSVLLEDSAGDGWLPCSLLAELESDDEGGELARTVIRVKRANDELDTVIACVSPHGPAWI